ncbi:MAG: CPBP family intramembrane metalloprotease [Pseudomonadales bacterium]|jgi:hypothetical protein|nr:CPBP family intramembrane metalloprotease [Pseudomonadales bacterium]HJN51153.1 CPBP family intramembrane glutamic endopeptidase [Pseudomonadales bacterium]|tara:strand:+ start:1052 stop:1690 length:639 start_codon:yes stop_codon:yes gene_type:complete
MGAYIGFHYGDVAPAEYESLITKIQLNGTVLSICSFATLIVCSSLVLCIVKLKKNSSIKHYLGLHTVSLNDIGFWSLVTIAFIFVSDLLTFLLGKPVVPEFMSAVYTSTESLWFLWLALIVAAPLFEELFFRGFLISGLKSSFVRPVGAVLISSALWAAIHLQYDLYGMLTVFVIGLMLGMARIKTDSVLLTVGMHSFMNLVATIETAIHVS